MSDEKKKLKKLNFSRKGRKNQIIITFFLKVEQRKHFKESMHDIMNVRGGNNHVKSINDRTSN